MKIHIIPSTNTTDEDVHNYSGPVIVYGPETIHQMVYKYPSADGYIVELGARIYIKHSSLISLPGLIRHRDFLTAKARTMPNIAFDLKDHPGKNILRMTPTEISKILGVDHFEAVKMKYREYSTIIIGKNIKEYSKLIYWPLSENVTFVSLPFWPCEFIETLDTYYNIETHAPKGNNTPCYL